MPHAIFVGLCTVDIVYLVDEFPVANRKVAAQSQSVYAGGPATNAAIACAHLGVDATLVSMAGRNPLTGIVRDELARYSVQLLDLSPDFEGIPAISSVSVDRNGNRNVVSANAAAVPIARVRVDPELCRQAQILMVDGHHMQACQAWAEAARACGTPVVLDGGSWKSGTEELLRNVDTAICSADFKPPGCSTASEVLRFLSEAGVSKIAITSGAEPIQILAGEFTASLPVPQLDAVDTTGAGDILHGAYCCFASLAKPEEESKTGRGFLLALTEAARIASASCRYYGTREWMRHPPSASIPAPAKKRQGTYCGSGSCI